MGNQKFYKEEYEVGKAALQIIHSKLGVRLPEDEAGHIALHLVNAELNEEMPNMVNITKIMNDILNIVKRHFRLEYDEESLAYYRFITHLKFLHNVSSTVLHLLIMRMVYLFW